MAACASTQTEAAEVQSGRWLNGERQKNTGSTAFSNVYSSSWQSDPRNESTVMISAGELRIKIARLSCHNCSQIASRGPHGTREVWGLSRAT